jgi:hypothetical protein
MSSRQALVVRQTVLALVASIFIVAIVFARADETAPASGKSYALGTIVSFGTTGTSERFKVSGWSRAEKEFTWTVGKSAALSLELPPTDTGLVLRMKLVGLIHAPELSYQPVEVYINGQKIADWQVSEPETFLAAIPKEIAGAKKLEIELRTPKSTTPKALKMNEDARVLGVACYEFEITKE